MLDMMAMELNRPCLSDIKFVDHLRLCGFTDQYQNYICSPCGYTIWRERIERMGKIYWRRLDRWQQIAFVGNTNKSVSFTHNFSVSVRSVLSAPWFTMNEWMCRYRKRFIALTLDKCGEWLNCIEIIIECARLIFDNSSPFRVWIKNDFLNLFFALFHR